MGNRSRYALKGSIRASNNNFKAKHKRRKAIPNGMDKTDRQIREPYYLGNHQYLRRDSVTLIGWVEGDFCMKQYKVIGNMRSIIGKIVNQNTDKPFNHLQ